MQVKQWGRMWQYAGQTVGIPRRRGSWMHRGVWHAYGPSYDSSGLACKAFPAYCRCHVCWRHESRACVRGTKGVHLVLARNKACIFVSLLATLNAPASSSNCTPCFRVSPHTEDGSVAIHSLCRLCCPLLACLCKHVRRCWEKHVRLSTPIK